MKRVIAIAVVFAFVSLEAAANDEPGSFELGVRGSILLSDGEPSNDTVGGGLFGRYVLDNGWIVGAALERKEFDFERPARLLGITQDSSLEAIDALAEVTDISVWLERRDAWNERWAWFWQAGGGVGSSDVTTVSGPVQGGGTFRIVTDSSTDPFLLGGLGLRYEPGEHWSIELAGQVQYRFADFKLNDEISGRSGSIGGYSAYGIYLGFAYEF